MSGAVRISDIDNNAKKEINSYGEEQDYNFE